MQTLWSQLQSSYITQLSNADVENLPCGCKKCKKPNLCPFCKVLCANLPCKSFEIKVE